MTTPTNDSGDSKVKPLVQIAHQYIKGTWMQRDLRGNFIRVNGKDINGLKNRQSKSKSDPSTKDSKAQVKAIKKQHKINVYIKAPLW